MAQVAATFIPKDPPGRRIPLLPSALPPLAVGGRGVPPTANPTGLHPSLPLVLQPGTCPQAYVECSSNTAPGISPRCSCPQQVAAPGPVLTHSQGLPLRRWDPCPLTPAAPFPPLPPPARRPAAPSPDQDPRAPVALSGQGGRCPRCSLSPPAPPGTPRTAGLVPRGRGLAGRRPSALGSRGGGRSAYLPTGSRAWIGSRSGQGPCHPHGAQLRADLQWLSVK